MIGIYKITKKENGKCYIGQSNNCERRFKEHQTKGASAKFSNEEVIKIRQRYVTESAKQIYKDYSDRVSYQTFQAMLWGRSYKNLPIYKKKEKKWINI